MFEKVFKNGESAFLLLLLFGFIGITVVEALQCYDCYDCEDIEELNELQICGELSITPTKGTTTTAIKSTTQSTFDKNSTTTITTKPSNETSNAPGKGDSFENIFVVSNNTTLRPGNLINNNKTTKTPTTTRRTTKKPAFNEDDSEEDEDVSDDDYDDDERRFRRHRRITSRTDDAVCYVLQLKVNGTTITKRGCATLLYDDDTCKSLASGYSLEKCHLCETDGCNKFADDDDEWGTLWNASVNFNALSIWFMLPLFGLLTLLKY